MFKSAVFFLTLAPVLAACGSFQRQVEVDIPMTDVQSTELQAIAVSVEQHVYALPRKQATVDKVAAVLATRDAAWLAALGAEHQALHVDQYRPSLARQIQRRVMAAHRGQADAEGVELILPSSDGGWAPLFENQ